MELHFISKNIFLMFCVMLFAENLTQGLPIQVVRCHPDDNSANCVEKGSFYKEAEEENAINFPTIKKRTSLFSNTALLSGEEPGSGSVGFPAEEPGSGDERSSAEEPGSEYDLSLEVPVSEKEYVVDYTDVSKMGDWNKKFNDNLFEENLIL